jgi:diguanylate cyclase (GGDEF)-like protein
MKMDINRGKNHVNRNLSKIAFALAVVIILGTGTFIFFSLRTLIESNRKVSHTLKTINGLEHLLVHLTELEISERGYVITGDERYLEPYFSELSPDGIQQQLMDLRQLSVDDPVLQSSLTSLVPLVTKKILFMQQVINLRVAKGFDAAKASITSNISSEMTTASLSLIDTVKQRETRILQQASTDASASLQYSIFSIAAGGVVGSLLLLLSLILLNREFAARKRVAEDLQQLNSELDQRVDERTSALRDYTEKLRLSEEHFRLLLDATKEYAMFMLDPQGEVLTRNQGAEQLKGLANRRLLTERINMFIGLCRRSKTMAALMIFDLDKSKPVNEVLSNGIGDLLLQQVATRTLGILQRSSDTLARLGGDQFVVLASPIVEIANAVSIAEKILKAIQEPFEIDGHVINVTCSIGIAVFPDHGENELTLMKNADEAMNSSKSRGGNSVTVYTGPVVDR